MQKNEKMSIGVELSGRELWNILKMFEDGEHVFISSKLHQKLITAYQNYVDTTAKQNKANKYPLPAKTVANAKQMFEQLGFEEVVVDQAWNKYLEIIQNHVGINHYEPIPYYDFAIVLKEFFYAVQTSKNPDLYLKRLNRKPVEAYDACLMILRDVCTELEKGVPTGFKTRSYRVTYINVNDKTKIDALKLAITTLEDLTK